MITAPSLAMVNNQTGKSLWIPITHSETWRGQLLLIPSLQARLGFWQCDTFEVPEAPKINRSIGGARGLSSRRLRLPNWLWE